MPAEKRGAGRPRLPKDDLPIVMCPGCRVAMDVTLVATIDEADSVDDITYRCPSCGTVTNRPTQRPQQA